MKKFVQLAAFLLMTGFLTLTGQALWAESLDFAVIQPGQPGSTQEARPVMDALASYVQQKLGTGQTVKGIYFNELDQALNFLRNTPPQWGIVSVEFYVAYAEKFGMTALAATRPGGFDKDIWRLAVGLDAPNDWGSLEGEVWGTMLFEPEAGAYLLFGNKQDKLPFKMSGTFQPLRSLRATSRGKAAGVVLDRLQYEALKSLPLTNKIKIDYTSKDLPTSPVVWFGPVEARTNRLIEILMGMRGDPNAEKLLKLLQTEGFGPADPKLRALRFGSHEGLSR